MTQKQQILDLAITHWQDNFTGVSAISVADNLNCAHEDVLTAFAELRDEECGTLREDVHLFRVLITKDNPSWSDEPEEIVTSIFFPAKELLAERFYQGPLAKQHLPEYVVRLHMGHSQIHLCYFSQDVLKKYLDRPEMFDVEDSVAGGLLSLSNEYLEAHESIDDLEGLMFVRFGKRATIEGRVTVTAILHDLSEMPAAEQHFWRSFEIDNPYFTPVDPDFEKFNKRNFEAAWIEYDDPLEKALTEMSRLNSALGAHFFSRTQNVFLAYPVLNTFKNFCDSCSELYKLFGPDNINIKVLKRLLVDHFDHTEDRFVHSPSGRPLSKLQLLMLLAQNVSSASVLVRVIEEIREHRVSAAHKIIEPAKLNKNYVSEFRRICEDLFSAMAVFTNDLESLFKR